MGPGTHVSKRINANIMPVSRNDFIAMTHDINYLLSGGSHTAMDRADDIAMANSDISMQGLILRAGLQVRKFAHLQEGVQDYKLGRELKFKVLENQDLQKLAVDYGLNIDQLFL